MKPLIVLLGVFTLSLFTSWLLHGQADLLFSGRLALAVMLCFTSIGHFKFKQGMRMMLPVVLPFKNETILLTGLLEIAAAVCIFIPGLERATGWFLVAFFVLLLPANIYAAINHVNIEKGTNDGPGPVYLLFRIPLQVLFIWWVWFFLLRTGFPVAV
jgi:uncharacterized membrane protein